jgi:DNA polymerase-4
MLHVDMDAFFASVEVLDHPELAGKPVIVGGSGDRGVVASCTYEARAYGVRSAMSSVEARRRCPQAVFMPGRYWRYAETSEKFHAVLKEFTPLVEGIGLDEAFLDVSGAVRLLGLPPHIAASVRARVREELKMDCSVGVARTKLLAKLGSREAKPQASATGVLAGSGVCVLEPSEEIPFLHPLPIRALWGVGPATARRLESLGISTVGALTEVPESTLCRLLGTVNGRHLAALARGDDDRSVQADRAVKSISHEETFARDVKDRNELRRHVLRMSDAVGARLAESALWGRTVSVKVRFADRQTITRSHTAAGPLRASHAVSTVAQALVDAVELPQGVRLIGVSVTGLDRADKVEARQLSFEAFEALESSGVSEILDGPSDRQSARSSARSFARSSALGDPVADVDEEAWLNVQEALSAIRARYGQGSVGPAALVGPGGLEAKGRGDTHWGPEADSSSEDPSRS